MLKVSFNKEDGGGTYLHAFQCIFVEQKNFRQCFSFKTLYVTDVKFTVDPRKNISRRITERLMTDWFIL